MKHIKCTRGPVCCNGLETNVQYPEKCLYILLLILLLLVKTLEMA